MALLLAQKRRVLCSVQCSTAECHVVCRCRISVGAPHCKRAPSSYRTRTHPPLPHGTRTHTAGALLPLDAAPAAACRPQAAAGARRPAGKAGVRSISFRALYFSFIGTPACGSGWRRASRRRARDARDATPSHCSHMANPHPHPHPKQPTLSPFTPAATALRLASPTQPL